jgi:DNA-directed RNA polymerase
MEQKAHIKEAISKDLAEPLLHALDVLSQTRWRINRKVFDTMIEAWNSGDAIADIPNSAEKANYVYPEKPKDVTQRIPFLYEFKRVTTQQRKDHAERCKQNYTLEIARAFVHDVFFLPHNMDFRGRCYPIPPYLSPTGDDMNRGLLMFADKKPLGKTGLRWLQIHLANVYGYDKMSFEERARFTQAHEAEIFESADNPLGGSRWWLKAEDPWQCLATCVEVTNALRSPNPEEYQCGLPVHQDGTCNGMQHYAALGGDVQGAKAVNLENGDRPSDVYSRVVDIVNKMIEADKKEGVALAQLIKEPLGRKIVKQTVMTTVYGVTFVGARDQIAKQLEARGDLNSSNIFSVSAYVAKTVSQYFARMRADVRFFPVLAIYSLVPKIFRNG